ncbi:MAG: hypothetical protein ABI921_08150 [Panacibacter sp.]
MKNNFILLLVFICVLNITCTKSATEITQNTLQAQDEQSAITEGALGKVVTYLIPKGNQYCTPNPLTFTTQSQLTFKAVFDSSCIYTTIDPVNQYDINKLYGFSDCSSHHLTNSARIGWRWSNDSLRIFSFVHNEGVMLMNEITTARIGSTIKCRITCLTDSYSFEVNGKSISVPRHCSGNYTRYKLYPYFGGDEVAPHDINIWIKEIN